MEKLAITTSGGDTTTVSEVVASNPNEMKQGGLIVTEKVKKGQVLQKNYILNDSAALKKKMKHEDREDPFNMGVEARDGSNMVVEMKTSFFEYVKAEFINDLIRTSGIVSVENGLASKAKTENSGTAFVEYSLDVSFNVLDKVFVTKLTAYTTSCRIMFQPVGSTPQMKALLGNKSVPRYFVDNFFLPWCQEAYAKKNYDEKGLLDAIRAEMKRLDMIKIEAKKARKEGRLTSVASTDIRCVAKVCKYTGLNTSNKSAVATCAKCGCFEHFECSKTKQEVREDIQKGELQYFCSICFLKNPSYIAFEASKPKKAQISPALGIIQVTSKTLAVPAPMPVDAKIVYKCTKCAFEAETNELLKVHESESHTEKDDQAAKNPPPCAEHKCTMCETAYSVKDELDKHMESHMKDPTYNCTICKKACVTNDDLNSHIDSNHSTMCPLCNLKFSDNAVFS